MVYTFPPNVTFLPPGNTAQLPQLLQMANIEPTALVVNDIESEQGKKSHTSYTYYKLYN